MLRFAALLPAALAVAGLAHAARASAQESPYIQALKTTVEAADDGACEEQFTRLIELWRDDQFETVLDGGKLYVISVIAGCAVELDDFSTYRKALDAARPLLDDPNEATRSMLFTALRLEEWGAAIDAFFDMAEANPEWLGDLEIRDVWRVVRAAQETSHENERAVFNALQAFDYAPPDALDRDDYLRVAHARVLIEDGDVDAAAERVGDIAAVGALIEMRSDKAFDEVRDRIGPDAWDVAEAVERELVVARADADAYPDRLRAQSSVVDALRALGRPQEAVDAADEALAAYDENPERFTDADDSLNWLRNERAYALYDLGRFNDGRSAMVRAIGDGEHGGANVSQVINSAMLMSDEGLAPRAIARITSLEGSMSPYGEMWAAAVHVCAHVQMGNAERVQEHLDFLRENETDNPSALARGLLCAGETEEAAALYVRRLQDPDLRGAALKALQVYDLGEIVLPGRAALYDRLDEVRRHPDVQAAVDAVGRIEVLPLHQTYWGDL